MIIYNNTEFRVCGFCDRIYSGIICPCYKEKENSKLKDILNTGRKLNNILIFITPYGN